MKLQPRYRPGDRIGGQYLVHKALRGGMGEVYLCLDLEEMHPYALKTFQQRYFTDNHHLRRAFKQEVTTSIVLGKHPNIVRCFSMLIFDNQPFMVLEWVAGEEGKGSDLRSWLRHGPLDLRLALEVAIDICRGLVHAQGKQPGLVHRDLKPENILMAEGGLAKITDFGLAQIVEAAGLEITGSLTTTGGRESFVGGHGIVGTPAYMAPEQWQGEVLDTRTDIYALGCVVYEMLVGRPIFQVEVKPSTSQTVQTWLCTLQAQHEHGRLPSLPNKLPSSLDSLLKGCLAKRRNERPASPRIVLEQLTAIYHGEFMCFPPRRPSDGEFSLADYINRGATYLNLGMRDEAVADFEQAITLDPNFASTFSKKNAPSLDLGESNQTWENDDQVRSLDPNSSSADSATFTFYRGLSQVDRNHLDILLQTHRKNLQNLEQQRAKFGAGEVPMHLHNQIAAEQREIARLGVQLNVDPIARSPVEERIPHGTDSSRDTSSRIEFRLLLLPRARDQMEVRGLHVPGGGQPKAVVHLPFASDELKAVLKALNLGHIDQERLKPDYLASLSNLHLLSGTRLRADFHQCVGQKLHQALFAGEILSEFEVARRSAKTVALQLYLDPEDDLLSQFPWELIHDGNMYLLPVKGGLEMTRYVTFQTPPVPLQTALPLRMLLIRPRPVNDNPLPPDHEKDALLNGLASLRTKGELVWQELDPPTWDALEECLNRETYDVLHFDGHGSFARLCPACGEAHYPSMQICVSCRTDMSDARPMGALHFEDENRGLDRVNVADLKAVMANSSTRLMVLTACSSGIVARTGVFNGIAPGLIQAGIPAVVAMQGSPTVGTMRKFVQRFYQGIADELPIPEAVNRARLAIYRDQPPAWFLPVIYLRSSDKSYGRLFRFESTI